MLNPVSRRTLITSAAGVAALTASPARAAPQKLVVGNASGALNQTLTALMKRMRFFEAFGLDAEILNVADGSRMLGAVVNGSIDISFMSGFGQILPAIERGGGLKVLGGGALTPTVSLYTGKPYIRSLKDLEGRTVGTGSVGALVHQLVVLLLRKYDVDVSKVRFVNIGSSADAFRSVIAGTIDAGPAPTAFLSEVGKYKVRPIPRGNMTVELAEYTYQGAWSSDRTIRDRRDVLVRGLAAQARLYRFLQSPQGRAPFIEARRSVFPNETANDHEAEWRFISTYKPFATGLALSRQRLDYMQRVNLSFDIQKRMLPFEQVADMSLATDAIRLLERTR